MIKLNHRISIISKLFLLGVVLISVFAVPLALRKDGSKISDIDYIAQSAQPAAQSPPTSAQQPTAPVAIKFNQLQINVDQSVYDQAKKQLLVPDNSAAWLQDSAKLNQSGSIFIYGHNSKAIFGSLKNLQTGDKITVVGEGGGEHLFAKNRTESLKPSDTSVLYDLKNKPDELILMTCSDDYFNSKRELTYFTEVESN